MALEVGRRILRFGYAPVIGADFFSGHLVRSAHGAESSELTFGSIGHVNDRCARMICGHAIIDYMQKLVEEGRVDYDQVL